MRENNFMRLLSALLALWLMSTVASAQTQTQTQTPAAAMDPSTMAVQSTRDPPRGFPYNTGGNADFPSGSMVPLRDFLSSRQDQQRAELIERIETQGRQLEKLIDERDRQYQQQFASQRAETQAALAAAKEAVLKAENAANERFDAGNEIKQAMSDQAETFMRISTAEARFKAVEEKANSVYERMNALQAQKEGGAETWGWLALIAGVLIALGSLLFNMNRSRPRAIRDDA